MRKYRPRRTTMCPTLLWYLPLDLSKVRLNQPKKPRLACACPYLAGFRMVAHRAGVRISAVSTDRPIADTMVMENCR